jgi:hypothetical protein
VKARAESPLPELPEPVSVASPDVCTIEEPAVVVVVVDPLAAVVVVVAPLPAVVVVVDPDPVVVVVVVVVVEPFAVVNCTVTGSADRSTLSVVSSAV